MARLARDKEVPGLCSNYNAASCLSLSIAILLSVCKEIVLTTFPSGCVKCI
jgi:hypothetical protein